MNGEPLPVEHGFPVRMVVPGLYGYVSATKWVVDLKRHHLRRADRLLDRPRLVAAGADQDRVPDRRARRASRRCRKGTVAIAGMAWAQHRGIAGVQVQIDDGEWQDATLSGEVSADTWRQWVVPVGRHRVRAAHHPVPCDRRHRSGADRADPGGDAGRIDGVGFPFGDRHRLTRPLRPARIQYGPAIQVHRPVPSAAIASGAPTFEHPLTFSAPILGADTSQGAHMMMKRALTLVAGAGPGPHPGRLRVQLHHRHQQHRRTLGRRVRRPRRP